MTKPQAKSQVSSGYQARVLVVDDEPDFKGLYSLWLEDEYDVLSASSGEEALDLLDPSVDVVLLDRRMPGLSGGDVVAEIRARSMDCRVVMVTAVEPNLDIIDMAFDGYLVKPVTEDDLMHVIELMLERSSYSSEVQNFFALAEKRATLEATLAEDEFGMSDEISELNARVGAAEDKADVALDELLDDGAENAGFRELSQVKQSNSTEET